METTTSLPLFQAWACPQQCMSTALGLHYSDDDWPSLPKFHSYYSGFLYRSTINSCFCTTMMHRTTINKKDGLLVGVARGSYETPVIEQVAQQTPYTYGVQGSDSIAFISFVRSIFQSIFRSHFRYIFRSLFKLLT